MLIFIYGWHIRRICGFAKGGVWLPCGYVMGDQEASVPAIPGLKSETPRLAGAGWGTLPCVPGKT
jgi:hypothetical protein